MAVEGKEMSFWEHLDEFRTVLFRSAAVVVGLMVVVFCFKSFVFDTIIFSPRTSDFIIYKWLNQLAAWKPWLSALEVDAFQIELINIEMSAQFFTHVSVSFWLGFVLAVPFILYQLWIFVRPALYPGEKKAVTASFAFCSLLFITGLMVGYFLVFPLTIKFLGTYQVSDWVENQISLKSYISMFTWLILMMGLVFEMPVLIHLLSRFGIVTKTFLRKYRRYAVVVLLFLAAIITPSGDAFTMSIVALPLYLLYEFSILVCKEKRVEEEAVETT
ncbi:MAG: twin-arginine translocase subunit TatC [Bacteroidales bacterium]|nr:twin-arginine translocase subunit TatC [Bacteroidales bacterium]MCL2739275.1 twin-arginine translocase subunit TatC [Bacteroidales bacterium]